MKIHLLCLQMFILVTEFSSIHCTNESCFRELQILTTFDSSEVSLNFTLSPRETCNLTHISISYSNRPVGYGTVLCMLDIHESGKRCQKKALKTICQCDFHNRTFEVRGAPKGWWTIEAQFQHEGVFKHNVTFEIKGDPKITDFTIIELPTSSSSSSTAKSGGNTPQVQTLPSTNGQEPNTSTAASAITTSTTTPAAAAAATSIAAATTATTTAAATTATTTTTVTSEAATTTTASSGGCGTSASVTVATSAAALDTASVVIAEENSTVRISCSWKEDSHLIIEAQLTSRGRPLNAKAGSVGSSAPPGHVDYVMPRVQCDDSGPVTCMLLGYDVKETRNLLVRCPPQFVHADDEMTTGLTKHSAASLSFPFSSYDPHLASCCVAQYDKDHTALGPYQPCPSARVTGIVPDLNLTLDLTSVTSQMAGKWRLKIENKLGAAEVDFHLQFGESNDGEEAKDMDERSWLQIYITSAVSMLCVIVLIVVSILLYRLKTTLREVRLRFLTRARNSRSHPRDRTAVTSLCYQDSNFSLMVNHQVRERLELKYDMDGVGYSEVVDSRAPRIPGLPLLPMLGPPPAPETGGEEEEERVYADIEDIFGVEDGEGDPGHGAEPQLYVSQETIRKTKDQQRKQRTAAEKMMAATSQQQ